MDEAGDIMDQIGQSTTEFIVAGQSALDMVWALAISYAFSIIGAVILIIVGYTVAGIVDRAVRNGLSRFKGFDETLRRFFATVARYAVLVLVGVTVLAQFGVQTASIIAALGAVGLAIGLALQGTLQNIAAGIMLLVLRPFRVGEFIDAGAVAGTVQEIGLFATELKTFDGVFVMAPNSQLWNSPVKNFSRNTQRMVEIEIGIGYGDDIDKARQIMLDIIRADSRAFNEPAPTAFVNALGDSAVMIKSRYWTSTADWWTSKLDNTKAMKEAYDANGISIPFPQREYRVVGTPEGGRSVLPG
jgi:small conductance mechanosensitive channel